MHRLKSHTCFCVDNGVLWNLSGCFFSTSVGGLRSYENPKNKITAVPGTDEEIWGATFKVAKPSQF